MRKAGCCCCCCCCAFTGLNTLDSLNDENDRGGHSSGEDSNEGRQGFFVGGSERSGQQVLGPNDAERRAQQLFEAVRQAGAETMTPEEAARVRAGANKGSQAGAYRLGSSNDAPVQQPPEQPNRDEPVVVRVILWQDGFSIDDGPLRSFEEPASRQFLTSLQQGSIPPELQQQHRGRQIDLHMERRPIAFVPPKAKPFSNQGQRLGSIVPEVVTIDDDGPSRSVLPKPSADEAKNLLESAQNAVGIDDSKPKGQIQIRQPSGERLIGEFNSTHTVEDVRSFIVSALPDFAFQPFQLHTTYPKKAIEDETQTVSDAGIFKAIVVMVKI